MQIEGKRHSRFTIICVNNVKYIFKLASIEKERVKSSSEVIKPGEKYHKTNKFSIPLKGNQNR